MQTTTPNPGRLLVATLLLLPGSVAHASLTGDRLVPLASDYLQPPATPSPFSAPDAAPAEPIDQLPPVVVSASPLPDITTNQVLTDAGRAFLAEQHYFTGATDTLNRVTLPLFGQSRRTIAMTRQVEDERLLALSRLDEQIKVLELTHPAAADTLADLRDAAFVRADSF